MTAQYAAVMRLVNWNLWWRFGPWQERRSAIESVLRDLVPDIVFVQELPAYSRRIILLLSSTWSSRRAVQIGKGEGGDIDVGAVLTAC